MSSQVHRPQISVLAGDYPLERVSTFHLVLLCRLFCHQLSGIFYKKESFSDSLASRVFKFSLFRETFDTTLCLKYLKAPGFVCHQCAQCFEASCLASMNPWSPISKSRKSYIIFYVPARQTYWKPIFFFSQMK